MNDDELYLNVPVGYPIDRKIAKSDTMAIKSFLISTTPDESLQDFIRAMSHDELIDACLSNGFTFDAEWYGYRELQGSL